MANYCPFFRDCGYPYWSYKCHIWWDDGLKWRLAKRWYLGWHELTLRKKFWAWWYGRKMKTFVQKEVA